MAAMQTAGASVWRDRRGASAMRFVRAIADRTERVLVTQRTGQWAIPHPNYHRPVPGGVWYQMEIPVMPAVISSVMTLAELGYRDGREGPRDRPPSGRLMKK
jgi:cation diffusion facilitator CzcD-associated flavoprotein CzcO